LSFGEFEKKKSKENFGAVPLVMNPFEHSNNAIRVESYDRRVLISDVSHSRVGDYPYFEELASYNTSIGETFYWLCKAHAENNSTFDEQMIPQTEAKRDQIIDNLSSMYLFTKVAYVLRRRSINKNFAVFMSEFRQYCT
jgi:hypothetical protein